MDVDHALIRALLICALLLCTVLPTLAQGDQVTALLDIKSAVGATSVNLSSWNESSAGPCVDGWLGITCDAYLNVIGLNVSSFGLSGQLPSNVFSSLNKLQSLDMSGNSLQSPLPTFDQLSVLHDLNISTNSLTGSFPTSITSLTSLVELRLDNNELTGLIPEQISNLQLIETLWLGNNTFSGPLPKGLASLSHLQILTVWGSNLGQDLPPEWGVWVNITYINLHVSQLVGSLPPEWGQNFTKLQRLHLYTNDLTGSIPDSWKSMTSLVEFRIKNNGLSGTVPSWLGQLAHNNAFVDLSCNYFSGLYPNFFNDTTWKGNCFDSDTRDHYLKCPDKGDCATGPSGGGGTKAKNPLPAGPIVGIVAAVILLLCGAFFAVYWRRTGPSKAKRNRRGQDAGDWVVPPGVRKFTYREISKATKAFATSCEIGQGGFGKVYLAQLEDGKCVAIKRASDLSFQGTKEFHNEITLLSRLHHRHLVRLEGFCDDRDEQILVYEYMKNGNLHHHLFDKQATTLNWYRRLEIALAVAQGLDYLHSFADPPVIHRDVKPSNILLDDNMTAKVSDFGISKANPEMDTHVSTRPAGTAGYLDPEYFLRRQLTTASDVYGYGVVLLELITGQLAIDHKRLEDYNLVGWVKPRLVKQGIQSIIDPRLGPNYPVNSYEEVAEIAVSCTAFERADRLSMQTVATKLEHVLSRLVPPPEHFMPVSSPSPYSLLRGKDSSSQMSTNADSTGPVSEVKLDFKDTVVEPR